MSNTIKDTLVELLRDAKAELKLVERERDEAREEIESIKKLLLDPNVVRINMLHGKIAKLDWEKLEHIHGNHPAREQLAAERALADRLAEGLRKMVLYSEALILRIQDRSDINFKTLNECIDLFNEWKEARSE